MPWLPISEYADNNETGILWRRYPNDWEDWEDYTAEEVRKAPKDYYE